MIDVESSWQFDVDRGPDWLFVKVRCTSDQFDDETPLAEHVWNLLQQHFTYRVVLELDQAPVLYSWLVGQLVLLHKRVHTHGGILRLCGVSDSNQSVLQACRLGDRFPQYANRQEAVYGFRPGKPR